MSVFKCSEDIKHLCIPPEYIDAAVIVPKTVIIEAVFGCNASCTMCPIDMPTERTKGTMEMALFEDVIDKLSPYAGEIKQLDVFGVGEPLLDKNYAKKIAYAKNKGFKNVGFATNAEFLTEGMANDVMNAGIDTIMISIDGVKKQTHESIRRKTHFEIVVNNTINAIKLRNANQQKTKFVIRFIKQQKNIAEWDEFRKYWSGIINTECGDLIAGYDLHSWGGEIDMKDTDRVPAVPDELPCHHLYDRMIILNDGSVPLCCADMHLCNVKIGDCTIDDPIKVYNSDIMNRIRKVHLSGKRTSMDICKACTILNSESKKYKSNESNANSF